MDIAHASTVAQAIQGESAKWELHPTTQELSFALLVVNQDQADHNTKPMEYWCISTEWSTSYYCMT